MLGKKGSWGDDGVVDSHVWRYEVQQHSARGLGGRILIRAGWIAERNGPGSTGIIRA
jgi:hypothetical protein